MHLAQPRLYWRVKQIDGTWKYEPAMFVFIEQQGSGMLAMVTFPPVPLSGVDESE